MCTAIGFRGKDLLYGFNLDVDPAVWNFALYKTKNIFTVGITVGKTVYYTHGVNRDGHFGNVPYMNGEVFPVPRGARRERIDLLVDRYIRGKYSFEDVCSAIENRSLVSVPAATLHSLIGNSRGDMLIAEPGYGCRKVTENYAVITNFPVLTILPDYTNPFYGKDRYDHALSVLQSAGEDFSVSDALTLLNETKQEGQWGTRVSFVYSANDNAVHYCLNGDFSDLRVHRFET